MWRTTGEGLNNASFGSVSNGGQQKRKSWKVAVYIMAAESETLEAFRHFQLT